MKHPQRKIEDPVKMAGEQEFQGVALAAGGTCKEFYVVRAAAGFVEWIEDCFESRWHRGLLQIGQSELVLVTVKNDFFSRLAKNCNRGC
jgi:hypothetical protein